MLRDSRPPWPRMRDLARHRPESLHELSAETREPSLDDVVSPRAVRIPELRGNTRPRPSVGESLANHVLDHVAIHVFHDQPFLLLSCFFMKQEFHRDVKARRR